MNRLLGILFLIVSFSYLYAEETYLNIDASFFEADEAKQLMVFKGNVKMTKNKDILICKKLVINTVPSKTNPNKQIPKDYKATGDVHFTIHTEQNILKGKGDTVLYYPDELKYIIIGNGYLEDTKEGKKVTANKIYIDEKTGHTKIDGDANKPVKFRLKIEDNKDKK
jgi:lipopolysaccharide transport protein LptA